MRYLARWLKKRSPFFISIYLSVFSFLVYASMYGIRRPYAAASFDGLMAFGMDYKTLLIIAQVMGYAFSKFLGIKIISEMTRDSRALAIVVLTGFAEMALLLFSLVSKPLNIVFLFLNGLPLGMIWGLVFSYLEGRRVTEFLGTMLSISFIVSSGFVKSIGRMLQSHYGLSDFNMPWVTGLIFFVPLCLFVWFLDQAPNPSPLDEMFRTKRVPMLRLQRKELFIQFSVGIILLTFSYVLLTVFRDLRDNFAAEIWAEMGLGTNHMIFTWSEVPIALAVLLVMASLMFIKDNRKAFFINNLIIMFGFLLIGISALAYKAGLIGPVAWMVYLGLGIYMGYLPYNSFLFDRLIAVFAKPSNACFFIYIADSFGYLGSVSVLFSKTIFAGDISWFQLLVKGAYIVSIVGSLCSALALLYFSHKFKSESLSSVQVPNTTGLRFLPIKIYVSLIKTKENE